MGLGSAFLSHQGGWDELLLVLAPVAVIVAILAVVKHRVDAAAERDAHTDGRSG